MTEIVAAAQSAPVSVDLTPIILALLGLIGALAGAGFLLSRRQKRLVEAETRKADAEAVQADATAVMSHAQYEGFIAEAAQRLQGISETAIARLQAELSRSQTRIAELETELERAKRERDANVVDAHRREGELRGELDHLRDQVIDLERRLEAQGVPIRRRRSDAEKRADRAAAKAPAAPNAEPSTG